MEITLEEICRLYYRYKRTSDENINIYLNDISIVRYANKGKDVDRDRGYFKLSDESMKKMREEPRNNSLTFDTFEISGERLENLIEYKKIPFLVKSTSRFFLKPDIGEVFDAIPLVDIRRGLRAICVGEDYETLPGTDGEHFVMYATLFQ